MSSAFALKLGEGGQLSKLSVGRLVKLREPIEPLEYA